VPTEVLANTGWKPDFTKADPYAGMPPEYEEKVKATFVPTEEHPLSPIEEARARGEVVGEEAPPPEPEPEPEEVEPAVEVTGKVEEAEMPVGAVAGKEVAKEVHPELVELVESGAPATEILALAKRTPGAYAAGIVKQLTSQFIAASELEGEEQFDAYQKLGYIEEDAIYGGTEDGRLTIFSPDQVRGIDEQIKLLEEQGIITSEYAETLRNKPPSEVIKILIPKLEQLTTIQKADILAQYGKATDATIEELKAMAKETEEKGIIPVAQYAEQEFRATNTQLPDGQWIDNKQLAKIKTDDPEIYTALISSGFAAASEIKATRLAEFEAAHTQLPDGQWISNEELARIQTESPKIYTALTAKGFAEADKLIAEQQAALDKLKDYRVSIEYPWEGQRMPKVGIDIAKYAEEHPETYMATLTTAGFTKTQIEEALRPVTVQYDTEALIDLMQLLQFRDEKTGKTKSLNSFLKEFEPEQREAKVKELWESISPEMQKQLGLAKQQHEIQRMWEIGIMPVYGTVKLWDELPTWGKVLSIVGDVLFLAPVVGINPLKYIVPGLIEKTPKLATTLSRVVASNVDDATKALGGINPNLLKPFQRTVSAATKYADDFAEVSRIRLGIQYYDNLLRSGQLTKGTKQYQAVVDLLREAYAKLPKATDTVNTSRTALLNIAKNYTDDLIENLNPSPAYRAVLKDIPNNIVRSVEGVAVPTAAQAGDTMALYYRLLAYKQTLPELEKYLRTLSKGTKQYDEVAEVIAGLRKSIPQLEDQIAYGIKTKYVIEAPTGDIWAPYYGGTATITTPKITTPISVTTVELTKTGVLPLITAYAGTRLAGLQAIQSVTAPKPMVSPTITPSPIRPDEPAIPVPMTPVSPITIVSPGISPAPGIAPTPSIFPAPSISPVAGIAISPEVAPTLAPAPTPALAPSPAPMPAPVPAAITGITSPVPPPPVSVPPPPPPILPFRRPEAMVERKKVKLPEGTIAFAMGAFWKYITPPWTQKKFLTLPRGVTPVGAVNTDLHSPYTTIQMIGRPGAKVPETISADIGIADVEIYNYGRSIKFAGRGTLTDVGERLESPTKGVSIPSVGIEEYRLAEVQTKPKHKPFRRPEARKYGRNRKKRNLLYEVTRPPTFSEMMG